MIRLNDLVLDCIQKFNDPDSDYTATKAGGVVTFSRLRFRKDGTPRPGQLILEVSTNEIRGIKDQCDEIKATITAFLAAV